MKKKLFWMLFCLTLILLLAAAPTFAAKKGKGGGDSGAPGYFSQGTILIAGDLDFNIASGSTEIKPDEGDKESTDQFKFSMGGLGGYFIIPRLEIGPFLNVEYTSDEGDDATEKSTTWAIGPQIGYFYPVANKFSIFGMFGVGYASTSDKIESDIEGEKDTETEGSGWLIQPKGGVVYHLSHNIGLSAALYLDYYTGDGTQDDGNADHDFDLTRTEYGLKIGLLGLFN